MLKKEKEELEKSSNDRVVRALQDGSLVEELEKQVKEQEKKVKELENEIDRLRHSSSPGKSAGQNKRKLNSSEHNLVNGELDNNTERKPPRSMIPTPPSSGDRRLYRLRRASSITR